MGAITLDGILRAEHEVLERASDEWLAMSDKPNEDIQWVMGVIDFASELIKTLENDDAGKHE